MGFYVKKIQKIISKKSYTIGWRYRHAKSFNDALSLFVDFVVDRLHELGDFPFEVSAGLRDITPEIKNKLHIQMLHFLLESKHTLANIVTEFATLLETYDITIPINEDAYFALQAILKKREQAILKEITAVHEKVINLEARALHTGLNQDASFKKELPILKALKTFSLEDLYLMFKTGKVPKVFSLIGDDEHLT